MAPQDIKLALSHRPFKPVRIRLRDGGHQDIREPRNTLVTRSILFVGLNPNHEGLPQKLIEIDPADVVWIENA